METILFFFFSCERNIYIYTFEVVKSLDYYSNFRFISSTILSL